MILNVFYKINYIKLMFIFNFLKINLLLIYLIQLLGNKEGWHVLKKLWRYRLAGLLCLKDS
jgi:hypothetical protein